MGQAGLNGPFVAALVAAVRLQTILVVMVILNLIGLTIAAYLVLRKK